jgi:Protein of unknown function (DUF3891)
MEPVVNASKAELCLRKEKERVMVIGWKEREPQKREPQDKNASAWAQVEAAQREIRLPCLLVPQPAHAVLAGELAAALLPDSFGELPPDVRRAIQMHDTGWASSDAQQIQRLRAGGPQADNRSPVSFVAIPPAETIEAWTASIDSLEAFSGVGATIVSRHFCLLAQHDQPHHQKFVQAEKTRQRRLGDTALNGKDLDRWTAALGFCDLLSLYLSSGLSRGVEFALAHPASPQAKTAPRVSMQVEGRKLRFTPATIRAGCKLTIQALIHPLPAQGPRAETLTWEVQ